MGNFDTEGTLAMFIPIVAILSSVALPIGFGMFLGLKSINAKHKERMELVKQGIIPPEQVKPIPNKYRSLRNGFLCIGIALGLIIGLLVSMLMGLSEDQGFFVVLSGILLFLGIAYVGFYVVTNGKKDIDNEMN